jgi:hypothetical protein
MDDAAPPPVEQAVLDDLRQRLRSYRRVATTGTAGWERGTEAEYLAELVRSWADEYDWRPHEQRIRALPWARAGRCTSGPKAGPSLRRDSTASHRQFRAVSASPACEPSPPVRL